MKKYRKYSVFVLVLISTALVLSFVILTPYKNANNIEEIYYSNESVIVKNNLNYSIEVTKKAINFIYENISENIIYNSVPINLTTENYFSLRLEKDPIKRIVVGSSQDILLLNPLNYEVFYFQVSEEETISWKKFQHINDGESLYIFVPVDSIIGNDRIILLSEKLEILDEIMLSSSNIINNRIPAPFTINNEGSIFFLSDSGTFNGSHSNLSIKKYSINNRLFNLESNYEIGFFYGAFTSITYIPNYRLGIVGDGFGYFIQYNYLLNQIEYCHNLAFFTGSGDEGLVNGSSFLLYDDTYHILIWTLETRYSRIDKSLMQFQYAWTPTDKLGTPFLLYGGGGGTLSLRNATILGFKEHEGNIIPIIYGYDIFDNNNIIRYDIVKEIPIYEEYNILLKYYPIQYGNQISAYDGEDWLSINLLDSNITRLDILSNYPISLENDITKIPFLVPIDIDKTRSTIKTSIVVDEKLVVDNLTLGISSNLQTLTKTILISNGELSFENPYFIRKDKDIKLKFNSENIDSNEILKVKLISNNGSVVSYTIDIGQINQELINKIQLKKTFFTILIGVNIISIFIGAIYFTKLVYFRVKKSAKNRQNYEIKIKNTITEITKNQEEINDYSKHVFGKEIYKTSSENMINLLKVPIDENSFKMSIINLNKLFEEINEQDIKELIRDRFLIKESKNQTKIRTLLNKEYNVNYPYKEGSINALSVLLNTLNPETQKMIKIRLIKKLRNKMAHSEPQADIVGICRDLTIEYPFSENNYVSNYLSLLQNYQDNLDKMKMDFMKYLKT